MITRYAAFWIIGVLGSLLSAQAPVVWETDLDKAFQKAGEARKPVLVCMHKLKEIACTRMLGSIYPDADVQRTFASYILVPSCPDAHPTVKVKNGDSVREECSAFPGITCAEHIALEAAVRARFFDQATIRVPQHIVAAADGKVLLNKIYEMKKIAFVDFLLRGLTLFSGGSAEAIDAQTKNYLHLVKTGSTQEREASVKALLDFRDDVRLNLLYDVIEELKVDKERAVCIRAMGYDQYQHAGLILRRWLEDDSVLIQNSAVVSLEETAGDGASALLVQLWGKAKDAELKKDILRAMGPCGEGRDDVKAILLSQVTHNDDRYRAAAYMSLGYYLDDPEVRSTLATRYKKEGKDVTLKTAIITAYRHSSDPAVVADLDQMVADEKNDSLKSLVQMVKTRAAGGGEGDGRRFYGFMKPLYTRDKIIRNRVKEFASYGGGR